MTYDDVHIHFTREEWSLLDASQKRLYKDVMLDTYRNFIAIGKTEFSFVFKNKGWGGAAVSLLLMLLYNLE